MRIDNLDEKGTNINSTNISDKLDSFHNAFQGSLDLSDSIIDGFDHETMQSIALWLNVENVSFNPEVNNLITEMTKRMMEGSMDSTGKHSVGLLDIYQYNIHPLYEYANYKQQAGFSAEVISTTKENLISKMFGTGTVTYRAGESPFPQYMNNHQFVDKIRVYKDGRIEKIQTKFVGKDAKSCWNLLKQKQFEKFLDDSKVDKIEIPKDYYDKMTQEIIPRDIERLELSLKRAQESGNTDLAEQYSKQLEKIKKLGSKLEKSNTTSDEAMLARKNPEAYAKKIFTQETLIDSHRAGLDSAAVAASITVAISTVDNVQKYMNGEITAQEAFVDIAIDAGKAGAIGYGAAFVSTSVSSLMSESSHQLIRSMGGMGVPAAVVSYGIDVYDSVIDYAQGDIDAEQLVYDLGEGGAHVGGAILGSAAAGAIVGSVVPGAGTVAGFGAGLVGGVVGCAIASEAYKTAVEYGSEGAKEIGRKATEMAKSTYEKAKTEIPEKADQVRNALNDFSNTYNLPFHI